MVSKRRVFSLTDARSKHVEAELYNYHETIYRIKELEENEIFATPIIEERVKSSVISDRTGKTAVKLASNHILNYMITMTNAINEVVEELEDGKQKMVHLRYWRDPPAEWTEIAHTVHVSEGHIYTWRAEVILKIKRRLGWP